MRQTFTPLVEKCKRLNRAMRIGTNHGSLSARILSYYGDTPRGMVESAFEFADICRWAPVALNPLANPEPLSPCVVLKRRPLRHLTIFRDALCLAHGLQEAVA